MQEINTEKINQYGYITKYPAFNKIEFEYIRKSIDSQYENVIKTKKIPSHNLEEHLKNNFKISQYHQVSKYLNHEETWPKNVRILPKGFTNWFLQSSYINQLKNTYGLIEITDEENLGYPNIYWRLVRPNISRDIGSLHRDSWFWEIDKLNGRNWPSHKRLKTWLSVNVEPGKNGLLVVPKSHKTNQIKWDIIDKDGRKKPRLQSNIDKNEIKLLSTKNNTIVIFNDDLIHGGSTNNGHTTRVSLEFTIFIKSNC